MLLAVTFALLGTVFVCISAFTLSTDQQVKGDLGRFTQGTYDNVLVGQLRPDFLPEINSAMTAAAPASDTFIESSRIRPDSFAPFFVQSPVDTVRFVEDPALTTSFPGRYSLSKGHWPTSRDDVVVSTHLLAALPDPTTFTALSGRLTMHVVGVVNDVYSTDSDLIVAGPQTWESIPPAAPGHAYQEVDAQIRTLWAGDGTQHDVDRVIITHLPTLPAGQGTRADNLASNYFDRNQLRAEPAHQFGDDQDLVVSFVPLLLVVLLVSALVVGQTRRAHSATADRLVALGVRRRRIRTLQTGITVFAALASIAVGLGAGWLIGIVLRAGVLPRYATQPLSPLPGIDLRIVGIAASSLIFIAIGTAWSRRSDHRKSPRGLARLGITVPFAWLRRLASVLAIATAVRLGGQAGTGSDTVAGAYLAMAGLLLLAPDALRVLLRALPEHRARTLVTRRLITSDFARQATASTVVACCIAIPICTATQLSSQKRLDNSLRYSRIPAHQIWIQNDGGSGRGDLTTISRLVGRTGEIGRPVVGRTLIVLSPAGDQITAQARFNRVPPSGESYSTAPLVVDSVADLHRVLGPQLPREADSVLNHGGVLDFTGAAGAQQLLVSSDNGQRTQISPMLPTLDVGVDQQLRVQFAGAILRSTAQQLGLPIGQPTKYIYTDVPTAAIGPAIAAAVDAGFDSEFVQYSVPPPPAELPTEAYAFLAGLVLGGFAIVLQVVRSQAKKLRSYGARLVALGLGPRWTLSILVIQTGLTVGIGILVGASAGLLSIILASVRYPEVDVPVMPVTLACAATVAAVSIAVFAAVRTLTAIENPDIN